MNSLVSVIMPYYDKKDYFFESINSVLNQTYTNLEIIIIYDDENKNDLDIIKELKKHKKRGECYKHFFSKDTELVDVVKRQINGIIINFRIMPYAGSITDGFSGFRFQVAGKVKKKNTYAFGEPFSIVDITPLGSDSEYDIFLRYGKNYFQLKGTSLQKKLVRTQITVPAKFKGNNDIPTPTPQNCKCKDVKTGEMIGYPCRGPLPEECIELIITPEPLVINTEKNYDYDKTTITNDAKKEIDKKIFKTLLDQPKNRLNGYINFLKDKEIIVKAYSSRDRDPKDKENGGVSACQKKDSTIADYNQCLSQKRAENVVKYLKSKNGGLLKDINFTAIGMGENCKSGFCWPSEQHSTKKTQLDRRFTVQFPMWDGKD